MYTLPQLPLRCWAEIDLAALERNLRLIRASLPAHIKYVAVVKADAYGHGLHQTVARLMHAGADLFAVANVTEAAAIGLYLADRYSLGKLAPAPDDPARAAYLRWSFFAPSVIEPGTMAKSSGWQFKPSQAGWGSYESMIAAMESAVAGRNYVLGDRFSMADAIFGGTIRFMLRFKIIEPTPTFVAYAERLAARPAAQRADERNAKIAQEHGLG